MTDRRNIFNPARKARGTVEGERRKIAIGFPKALFDRINTLASFNKCSFNEQAIVLCETAINGPVYLTSVDGEQRVSVGR